MVFSAAKTARVAAPLKRESYSQWQEDLWLAALFRHRSGRYLDIGAGNPVHLSNTYLAYRAGWSGVAVDPVRANGWLARLLRPRDTWITGLISNAAGTVPFYEFEPSFYSTSDHRVSAQRVKDGAALIRRADMAARPVRDLPFSATPEEDTFASIDVEGHEYEVLESFAWNRQKPAVVVLEMWDLAERQSTNLRCRELLKHHGYLLARRFGPDNEAYVHVDAKERLNCTPATQLRP
jgi:hypothetical protein